MILGKAQIKSISMTLRAFNDLLQNLKSLNGWYNFPATSKKKNSKWSRNSGAENHAMVTYINLDTYNTILSQPVVFLDMLTLLLKSTALYTTITNFRYRICTHEEWVHSISLSHLLPIWRGFNIFNVVIICHRHGAFQSADTCKHLYYLPDLVPGISFLYIRATNILPVDDAGKMCKITDKVLQLRNCFATFEVRKPLLRKTSDHTLCFLDAVFSTLVILEGHQNVPVQQAIYCQLL